MAEALFGLSDCGATHTRVVVLDARGYAPRVDHIKTDPDDYEASIQKITDSMLDRSKGRGELVAASVAVAAELDPKGKITRAGRLSSWVGHDLGTDIPAALGLDIERVGLLTDTEALAISQQRTNKTNGRPVDGMALTLSSGWGAARYRRTGEVERDGPGHVHLRHGAMCPCGEEGHAEAFISGKGVRLNHGVKMKKLLRDSQAANQLVADIATATIDLLDRHRKTDGFVPEEMRWTGGVVINQPFMMQQAFAVIRERLGDETPVFDALSMGDKAGLDGAFIEARRLAEAV